MKRQSKAVQKTLTQFIKAAPLVSNNPESVGVSPFKSEGESKGTSNDLDKGLLRICAWNVNGIRSVLRSGELKSFIEKAKPQILCLNETKIDD